MTVALTPELALAYLGALSTDMRAGAVLDEHGALEAGDAELGARAAALVRAAGADAVRRAQRGDGTVFAVRSSRHAVAVEVGPHALAAVVVDDLRAVLADLPA